ncbi:glycosyltransferase family 9 protein [Paracrocinitomix mangrovi]|uniref:glycosyltransferase family 9 protein n=1 Tax=Paracrocinitomix mangrovi TaxID=2862509 RepID=UPI001EDBC375|nr:glycosyltransferase family 9 protein [Paracrocinitomix mangrovi]UKN02812.1 glycosyltransferase family 9 protein [Paracrocinitomix mangrovi]
MIIQTAFIGDVILATALLESIHDKLPQAKIDVLVRSGNEGLLANHPFINKVYVWDKKNQKFKNLKSILKEVKKTKYDLLINLQRFGSTGWFAWRAKSRIKVGFDKNPFSFCYTHKVKHQVQDGTHEINRNFNLIKEIGEFELKKPKLYPAQSDLDKAAAIKGDGEIVVLAPSSVWYTKALPLEKWIEIIQQYKEDVKIVLIGANSDKKLLDEIVEKSKRKNVHNAAGELSLLASSALISMAIMTHVNDSAPLHLASACNAPVTAYFCSTIPEFGFGPLSDNSTIKQTTEKLDCRPCGLHGKSQCPKGHFKCGKTIDVTFF